MIGPILVCFFLCRMQIYFGKTWFGGMAPEYLVPVMIFLGVHFPKTKCYWLFFVLGLFLDTFSLCPFGVHATLYLFFGYLFSCFKNSVYHESVVSQSIWASVLTLWIYLSNLALLQYYNLETPVFSWGILFSKFLLTFLFSLPILLLLEDSLKWFAAKPSVSLRSLY